MKYNSNDYFLNYKYWHWLRGGSLSFYVDSPTHKRLMPQVRKTIHKQLTYEGLELHGETARHDAIINAAFMLHCNVGPNYTQDNPELGWTLIQSTANVTRG